jgi:hypothetical protein
VALVAAVAAFLDVLVFYVPSVLRLANVQAHVHPAANLR